MAYNLLTVGAVGPAVMARALAGVLGVAVTDVDVAHADGDQEARDWEAAVLCTYHGLRGDLACSLDVYAQEFVADRPAEYEVAAALAQVAGTTVLFPADEAPPSAYWAVTPEGLVARARLEPSGDEPPVFTVTSVGAPVPELPGAVVERFAEIVREQRPETPVADAFLASVTAFPLDGSLVVWERVIRQMESGWAPSGWYPADLYRERLEARDALAEGITELPREVAVRLGEVLRELDARFVAGTEDDPAGSLHGESTGAGWWWFRKPAPVPWDTP
ncbi:hypothetical protein K388_04888 [Streptomyces sp. KhCrAH-43]|nr:hypothetical protein [Streptomyces sp. SID4920]MYX70821.1 hypothetical protein [Streptomyces sp. SID8373]RAJ55969.1 hypothetical protein K388_04888 [Streptomyces sp. KhCrAH-43]